MRSLNRLVKPFLLLFLCLLAIGGVTFLTRWGAGTTPDSVVYITAARTLLSGEGLQSMRGDGSFAPVIHFPPLYPLILALPGLAGFDPLQIARWINISLYVANILLIALMVYSFKRDASWAPILAAVIALTSFHLLSLHSMVWSEPIFIFLGFIGFWLLVIYLYDQRIRYLIAASLFLALAWLTRYAGIAMIAAAIAGVLFLSKQKRIRRFFDSVTLAILTSLPMVFWFARNQRISGELTNRSLIFHPITGDIIVEAFDTVSQWILPIVIPGHIRVGFLLLILFSVLAIVILRNRGHYRRAFKDLSLPIKRQSILVRLLLMFVIIYLGFLFLAISLADANTPLNLRILAPVLVSGIVIVFCLDLEISNNRKQLLRIMYLIILGLYSVQCIGLMYLKRDGLGYSSKSWHDSETLSFVESLPENVAITSNAPDAILLLTGRKTRGLPSWINPSNLKENKGFQKQLDDIWLEFQRNEGYFVLFDIMESRWYLPDAVDLERRLKLQLVKNTADGVIYVPQS